MLGRAADCDVVWSLIPQRKVPVPWLARFSSPGECQGDMQSCGTGSSFLSVCRGDLVILRRVNEDTRSSWIHRAPDLFFGCLQALRSEMCLEDTSTSFSYLSR